MLRKIHGIPNYTYLKLEMGPHRVITVGTSF
jgi:hypothetical protein